jgi:glycosyltransferase involved in cell wall biosynthesis
MRGKGPGFLRESFEILATQTFKDFDVVISDESKTDVIKKVCDEFKDILDIKYFKNPDGLNQFATNTNYSIGKATGKLIKILLLDDFLYDKDSLKHIADNFDLSKDHWLVTACEHSTDGKTFFKPFYPRYNKKIHFGRNTISSPSVLTVKNDNPLLFDLGLKWYADCDYYKRCYDQFRLPKIVQQISVVNRIGEHQTTQTVDMDLKLKEFIHVLRKYYSEPRIKVILLRRSIRIKIVHVARLIKKTLCL